MRRWCESAWLRVLLAAVMVSTTTPRPRAEGEDPQSAPTTAPKQPDPRASTIDLSDPMVRARLRAKGVDPDELLRLFKEQGIQGTAPGAPTSPQTPTFPPVTPPPGPVVAPADSTALPDSVQAQQRARGQVRNTRTISEPETRRHRALSFRLWRTGNAVHGRMANKEATGSQATVDLIVGHSLRTRLCARENAVLPRRKRERVGL